MSEQTFGEVAVGLSFNPSGEDAVHRLKAAAAAFIDLCHEARMTALEQPSEGSPNEVARMFSLAITAAQEAQMWSVKAATWRL